VKKKPSDFHQVSTPEDAASTSKVQVGVDIPREQTNEKGANHHHQSSEGTKEPANHTAVEGKG
jgi:hypothetical protein